VTIITEREDADEPQTFLNLNRICDKGYQQAYKEVYPLLIEKTILNELSRKV